MYIVVGLGNIGAEYKNTFHNIGFLVADKLAEKLSVSFGKEKYKAVVAEGFFMITMLLPLVRIVINR